MLAGSGSDRRLIHPLGDGVLYSHWTDVLDLDWRWKNFTPQELACSAEGEFYWHERSFDALQKARDAFGQPLTINSAHRSWLHNIAVGGAPKSMHKHVAFDISTRGYGRRLLVELLTALRRAGFKGIGYYNSFIHVDLGRGRFWFSSDSAMKKWMPVMRLAV